MKFHHRERACREDNRVTILHLFEKEGVGEGEEEEEEKRLPPFLPFLRKRKGKKKGVVWKRGNFFPLEESNNNILDPVSMAMGSRLIQ